MKEGNIVKGKITGIKPYGAFVKIDKDYNGLVHISEFSDGFVRSIEDYVSIGEYVNLQVMSINESENKVKLSYKSVNKEKKRAEIKLTHGFSPLEEEINRWIERYDNKNDE